MSICPLHQFRAQQNSIPESGAETVSRLCHHGVLLCLKALTPKSYRNVTRVSLGYESLTWKSGTWRHLVEGFPLSSLRACVNPSVFNVRAASSGIQQRVIEAYSHRVGGHAEVRKLHGRSELSSRARELKRAFLKDCDLVLHTQEGLSERETTEGTIGSRREYENVELLHGASGVVEWNMNKVLFKKASLASRDR